MKPTKTRLPSISCPHCNARSIVRASVQITETVRELRLVCQDDACGHTFVAQLAVIRTIRPSLKPNPLIRLPNGDWRSRPANDDMPLPANDTEAPATAVEAPG